MPSDNRLLCFWCGVAAAFGPVEQCCCRRRALCIARAHSTKCARRRAMAAPHPTSGRLSHQNRPDFRAPPTRLNSARPALLISHYRRLLSLFSFCARSLQSSIGWRALICDNNLVVVGLLCIVVVVVVARKSDEQQQHTALRANSNPATRRAPAPNHVLFVAVGRVFVCDMSN